MASPSQYAVLGPLAAGVESRAFLGCEVIGGLSRPDSPVVVVWLPDDVARDERLVARIQRETAFVTQLRHSNIYRTLGLECFDEGWARLLAYVDGEPLSRVLSALRDANRGLDPRVAALVLLNACDGVRYAHEEGQMRYAGRPIVHGALRPDTLFVSFEGSTLVTGFGAAGVLPSPQGTVLSYLAPEQIIGGKSTAGPATDVYALGVVLYELLSGRAPFSDATDVEKAVLTADAAPIVGTGVTARLAGVAARAMAKRGPERFESVAVMRDAIMDALEGAPLPSHSELAALLEGLFPSTSPERVQRRTLLQSAVDPDALTILSRPTEAPPGVDPALFEASRPEARSMSMSPLPPLSLGSLGASPILPGEQLEDANTVVEPPSAHPHLPVVFPDSMPQEGTGEVTGGQIMRSTAASLPAARPENPAVGLEDAGLGSSRQVSQMTEPMLRLPVESRQPSPSLDPPILDSIPPSPEARAQAPAAESAVAPSGAEAAAQAAQVAPETAPPSSAAAPPSSAVASPSSAAASPSSAAASPSSAAAPEPAGTPTEAESGMRAALLAPASMPSPVPQAPMRELSSITNFDKAVGDSSRSVLIGVLAAATLAIGGVFWFSEAPPEVRESANEETRHILPKEMVRAALEKAGTESEAPPVEAEEPATDADSGKDHPPAAGEPRTGHIVLTSDPKVDVYFGNQLLGHTPLEADLPMGVQKLRFTDKDSGINTYKSYRVKGGGEIKDDVVFGSSELVVEAPDGASILLNARFIGKAPLAPVKIYEGKYQLKVTLDGKSWADVFDAPAGRKINYKVTLKD